ncbi:MAG: hypothetical protein IT342_18810 [Candidatus Melainabacteria bacterium]|nr:hypothetical protein [Candidatus Melainabacteria bacterium]
MAFQIPTRRRFTSIAVALGMVFASNMSAGVRAQTNKGFTEHVMNMAKERKKVEDMQWNSPAQDSANNGSTSKSWTVRDIGNYEKPFLNSLKWQECKVGKYVLRTGLIFDKWIAAMQFVKNGKLVLTEITPPYEYVRIVDPLTALLQAKPIALDADKDGNLEIAFLHEKLNDADYHMYTVYRLNDDYPHLIWKSGGELGDWINGSVATRSAKIKLRSGAETK